MNIYSNSLAPTSSRKPYSSSGDAKLTKPLSALKTAWENRLDGEIRNAERALLMHDKAMYRSYQQARDSSPNDVTDWCGGQLNALNKGVVKESVPQQPVKQNALFAISRPHPVEKLLARKTEREPQKEPAPVDERSFLEKKLSHHKARGEVQVRESISQETSLTVKPSWRTLIAKLRDEKDRTTALALQKKLEEIARDSGKTIDTGFLTTMCCSGKTLQNYLERFRKSEAEEVQLLKEMVNLDLHKSAGGLCHNKGFISRQLFDDLKTLRTRCGKDIQRAITALQKTKAHICFGSVDELIRWCTIDEKLDVDLLRHVTSLQTGKGMPTRVAFNQLLDACTIDGTLETHLVRSVAGMHSGQGIPEPEVIEALKECGKDSNGQLQLRQVSSITGMQRGKGVPKLTELAALMKACSFKDADGKDQLDKDLFSSITGMQCRKGMPKLTELAALMQACSFMDEDGKDQLDKDLFSSVTGMQNGKGMPKLTELAALMKACSFKDEDGKDQLDKDLFSSITGMQSGKGVPDPKQLEALMKAFTFKDERGEDKLDTQLFRSVIAMLRKTGMPRNPALFKTLLSELQRLRQFCTFKDKHGKDQLDKILFTGITRLQKGEGVPDLKQLEALKEACTFQSRLSAPMLLRQWRHHKGMPQHGHPGKAQKEHTSHGETNVGNPHALGAGMQEHFDEDKADAQMSNHGGDHPEGEHVVLNEPELGVFLDLDQGAEFLPYFPSPLHSPRLDDLEWRDWVP